MNWQVILCFAVFFFSEVLLVEAGSKCDFFQELNISTQQCMCKLDLYPYICELKELPVGYCMTYDDESTGKVTTGPCPYQQDLDGSITLDKEHFKLKVLVYSGEELNNATCSHLNREGLLCGRCKQHFGTAVYSKSFKCVYCDDRYEAWMWYVALETVPITLVYFIIIIFNIRATSPPYTSFLFHSQFFSLINTISVYKILLGHGANQTLYRVTMAVLDIWNLDALKHILPFFCVSSSLSNFQVQVMRLVSSLFPLVLVVLSYIVIELHGRNCKLLVFLWKPLNKCISQFRRNWDARSSNIAAFSTIMTLSLLKVWSLALFLLFQDQIHFQGGANDTLYVDPYYDETRGIAHAPFFWPLVLILVMATVIPTAVLCIYPTRVCRTTFFCCKTNKFEILRIFTETFQGHYKDGTNSTCDYRAASSLVFIIRIIASVFFFPSTSRTGNPEHTLLPTIVYGLIALSLFYAVVQPCKKRYMNNVESLMYALTAISFVALINANLNLEQKWST